MNTPLRFRLLAFALVLFAGHQTAAAQSGQAILDRLGERYAAVNTLQADFSEVRGSSSVQGSLTLRGDAYRITVGDQTLVSDGTTAWSYSQSENQVVIQALEDATGGFSITELLTDYATIFTLEEARRSSIGGVPHDVLTLSPRESGTSLQRAVLFVRSRDAVPTRVTLSDVNGTEVTIRLSNIRVNPPVGSGTFRFVPPRGAEVINLRAQ